MVMSAPRRGTCVAGFQSVRAVALSAGSAILMMGCLVTEKVEFVDEQNLPPSILVPESARYSPREIFTFDINSMGAPVDGGTGVAELRFEVEVRDPNLDDRLFAQSFTDIGRRRPVEEVPPSGAISRSFTFTINAADFSPATDQNPLAAPGCHRVDLCVSSAFADRCVAVDPIDLAAATWWVRVINSAASPEVNAIDLAECPRPL